MMATLLSLAAYLLYILCMMATVLLSIAGYLLYIPCMMLLSFLLLGALVTAWPSLENRISIFIMFPIAHIIVLALKNFLWVVLVSESHYTLPSSVSQVIACLSCYLVCAMVGVAMTYTFHFIFRTASGSVSYIFFLGIIMVVTSVVTSLVVMDMLLRYSNTMATVLSLTAYPVCMVALSCLVLIVAVGAIENTKTWWPELIHTSIVALTLLLLNMMWGSPFQKPASADDPNMKSALVGYLIYIVCSTALTCNLFGALLLLKTFVISVTFVLLDMFVKPSSLSGSIATLVGLSGLITTTLLALFFLVALSFLVFMFLHTWVEILVPSVRHDYPVGTFMIIFGFTFMGIKIMFDMPVEEPSIFFGMKAGLLGITEMINDYRGVCMMIRFFTYLAVPLLSLESRRKVSMNRLCTMSAFMVALGLVVMMPITENSASTLVTDDFVQQTIQSLVNSQIKRMDGGIELLTDS